MSYGCHPSNAVRTKCACGTVLSLGRTRVRNQPPVVTCPTCSRKHQKCSGGFRGADNGGKREGGKEGCPGL